MNASQSVYDGAEGWSSGPYSYLSTQHTLAQSNYQGFRLAGLATVPEPSIFGLIGAAGLAGLLLFRTKLASKKGLN